MVSSENTVTKKALHTIIDSVLIMKSYTLNPQWKSTTKPLPHSQMEKFVEMVYATWQIIRYEKRAVISVIVVCVYVWVCLCVYACGVYSMLNVLPYAFTPLVHYL